MNILQFLFGKNLSDSVSLKPGTFYLDVEKNELWYDDPSNTSTEHNKVIDTATLIYELSEDVITYPSEGSEDAALDFVTSGATSAVLGVAVLGTMVLGSS